MLLRNSFAVILLTSLCVPGLAHAAPVANAPYPEYRVTVVGPANSQPTDINNAGIVAGTYPVSPTATRAFLNRGKGFVDLGTLPFADAVTPARALNNRNQVTGQSGPLTVPCAARPHLR